MAGNLYALITDPEFNALSHQQQIETLAKFDPEFAGLNSDTLREFKLKMGADKAGVQSAPAEGERLGFFATVGNALANGPRQLMDAITSSHPIKDLIQPNIDMYNRGTQEQGQGHRFTGAMSKGLAAMPVLGPGIDAAAEELAQGNPGGAAGHFVNTMAPFALPSAVESVPALRSPLTIGKPRLSPASTALKDLHVGPTTLGVYGAARRLSQLKVQSPLEPVRPGLTADQMRIVDTMRRLKSNPQAGEDLLGRVGDMPARYYDTEEALDPSPPALPSGRIPGTGVPKPPPPPKPLSLDQYNIVEGFKKLKKLKEDLATMPRSGQMPTAVEPIPGQLPSGRVPGRGVPKLPGPTPVPKPPLWQGLTTGQGPSPIEPLEPIPATLPSGRVPGTGVQATPVQPPPHIPQWRGLTTGAGPQPVGAMEPLPEVTLPSGRIPGKPQPKEITPVPQATQPTAPPLTRFEMNRMAHARAQELELPGSPSGKNGHPLLTQVAKDVFGEKSWSDLDVVQMRKVYDFLDTHKRMPTKGEL